MFKFILQALFQSSQHIYEKREGSGSVPMTNGSGSGSRRLKNMRILRIRFQIWIPNIALYRCTLWCKLIFFFENSILSRIMIFLPSSRIVVQRSYGPQKKVQITKQWFQQHKNALVFGLRKYRYCTGMYRTVCTSEFQKQVNISSPLSMILTARTVFRLQKQRK